MNGFTPRRRHSNSDRNTGSNFLRGCTSFSCPRSAPTGVGRRAKDSNPGPAARCIRPRWRSSRLRPPTSNCRRTSGSNRVTEDRRKITFLFRYLITRTATRSGPGVAWVLAPTNLPQGATGCLSASADRLWQTSTDKRAEGGNLRIVGKGAFGNDRIHATAVEQQYHPVVLKYPLVVGPGEL